MAEGGPGATQDVVTALRAVPGVADASITPDRRLGGAGTLHLTLVPGANEVTVAHAVNQVLREHFGLAVDTANISVVDETSPVRLSAVPEDPVLPRPMAPTFGPPQAAPDPAVPAVSGLSAVPGLVEDELDAEEPPEEQATPESLEDAPESSAPVPAGRGPRLLIERMQLVAADLGVETEVTLGLKGDSWTGHADSAATPSAVHRAVAAATLDAVQQCVDRAMRLELEHLEVPALGSERAVVVEVSLVTRRGAERLTGVSAVRDDVRQAVIRATLDALNRRLESVLVPA